MPCEDEGGDRGDLLQAKDPMLLAPGSGTSGLQTPGSTFLCKPSCSWGFVMAPQELTCLLPFRRSHGHVSFSIVLKGGAGLVLVSMCVGSMIQEQRSEPQVLADKNEASTEWHSPRKVRPAPWEEDLGFGVRHPGLSICWLKRLFPESRCWARPRAGLWALLFLRSRPGDGPSEVP